MLIVVKQNGIETCFLTSISIYQKCVTLGGRTDNLTTNDGFEVMAYAKYSV